jgi:hypothetical protein
MPCLDVACEVGHNLDVALHNAMSLCTKHRRVQGNRWGRIPPNASSFLFYPSGNSSLCLAMQVHKNDVRPAAGRIVARFFSADFVKCPRVPL